MFTQVCFHRTDNMLIYIQNDTWIKNAQYCISPKGRSSNRKTSLFLPQSGHINSRECTRQPSSTSTERSRPAVEYVRANKAFTPPHLKHTRVL